jgi:hypothetical protein
MNNVGVNQGLGEKQGASPSASKRNEDPASKNLAGSKQPAAPGTVVAMNNAGSNQSLGQKATIANCPLGLVLPRDSPSSHHGKPLLWAIPEPVQEK